MKCPHCLSENTHFVSNTKSTGPSFSKGCCGAILFGPIGILCSLCGVSSETEEYWMCYSCGKRFEGGEYESELQARNNRVNRLKNEITLLNEDLKNKPRNLSKLIKEAEIEYNDAKKRYDTYEKEFINSSNLLKVVNKITMLVSLVAFIILGGGVIGGLSLIGNGGFTMILVSVVVFLLIILIVATIDEKVKKSVDLEKAEYLERLGEERDLKKKTYKELLQIQEKVDKHEAKVKDLGVAEDELKNYLKK